MYLEIGLNVKSNWKAEKSLGRPKTHPLKIGSELLQMTFGSCHSDVPSKQLYGLFLEFLDIYMYHT